MSNRREALEQAQEAFDKAMSQAWEAFDEALDHAEEVFGVARDQAWEAYEKALAQAKKLPHRKAKEEAHSGKHDIILPDDRRIPLSPFFLEDEEEGADQTPEPWKELIEAKEAEREAWRAYEKARALTWEDYGSRGDREKAVAQAEEVYLKAKAQVKKLTE